MLRMDLYGGESDGSGDNNQSDMPNPNAVAKVIKMKNLKMQFLFEDFERNFGNGPICSSSVLWNVFHRMVNVILFFLHLNEHFIQKINNLLHLWGLIHDLK